MDVQPAFLQITQPVPFCVRCHVYLWYFSRIPGAGLGVEPQHSLELASQRFTRTHRLGGADSRESGRGRGDASHLMSNSVWFEFDVFAVCTNE